jgi:Protein of unknown function (DUF3455)
MLHPVRLRLRTVGFEAVAGTAQTRSTTMKYLLSTLATASLLGACASAPSPMMAVDNTKLPEAVRAPAGQKMLMAATGVGEITYECREKKDAAGQHEWAFVAPVAMLYAADRKVVGKYYAGPTWESMDGSKVTGKQLAVSPATPGSIPLQLVKADPAMGSGAMTGVSYIQRVNTKGGVAPAMACDAAAKGKRQQVAYEADYVFYGS